MEASDKEATHDDVFHEVIPQTGLFFSNFQNDIVKLIRLERYLSEFPNFWTTSGPNFLLKLETELLQQISNFYFRF